MCERGVDIAIGQTAFEIRAQTILRDSLVCPLRAPLQYPLNFFFFLFCSIFIGSYLSTHKMKTFYERFDQ